MVGEMISKMRMKKVAILGFLSVLSLIIVIPFLFLLFNTFKPPTKTLLSPLELPTKIVVENYTGVWQYMKTALFNSAIVTGGSVLLLVSLCPLAAYGLSTFDFKGRNFVYIVILMGIYAIPVSGMVPIMKWLEFLGLLNTRLGLILVYFGLYAPTAIFISQGYFRELSQTYDEAAEIDGLSPYKKFWKIYMPLAKPILLTLTLIMTVYVWNEYALALVILQDASKYTVPVMLASLGGEYCVPWGLKIAGIFISAVPMVLLVILFSNRLKKGMGFGAVGE